MKLQAAIGRYKHTERVMADPRFDFAAMPVISRAFKPMVRDARFDVSELAIATFLQAKAAGTPIVLLPVVLAARFQQAALLCLASSGLAGPAALAGRRIGVRAYSQTTALWLRGELADEYGVQPDQVRWTTFEDGHVAGIADPAWAERAPPGADMLALLRAGQLDAVIVGNDVPDAADLRPVFPDPHAAADAFWTRHLFVPVNHMVTVRRALADRDPLLVADLVRLFHAEQAGTGFAQTRATLAPALALALRFAAEQGLLPRVLTLDEVWDGLPAGIA